MTIDAALLFAAGFGTRMGSLTRNTPKPMIPVAGKPLVDHALKLCDGIDRVVVNTHYLSEQIEEYLSPRNIRISPETPDVLETGGGLKHARPLLRANPVFTLNTDAVWAGPNPLDILAAAWRPDAMDALLIGIARSRAAGHKGKGDFTIDPEGRAAPGPGLIYGGAQIIKTDLLDQIDDTVFSMWRLWQPMLDAGRLFVAEYPGRWCDVGHPEGIKLAEEMLDQYDV